MLCTSREQWVWPLSVEEHSRVTLWLSGLGTGAKPSAPISTVPALSPAQLLPFSLLLSEPHFFLKNKKGTPQTVRVLSSAYSVIWSFVIRTVGTGEDGCFNHLRIKERILKTKL